MQGSQSCDWGSTPHRSMFFSLFDTQRNVNVLCCLSINAWGWCQTMLRQFSPVWESTPSELHEPTRRSRVSGEYHDAVPTACIRRRGSRGAPIRRAGRGSREARPLV